MVLSFVLGLIFGSFFNSLIFRLEKKESFIFSRSYCPNCKTTLKFLDLIPLFSFLFLKGKCRYCGRKISWVYFLGELITGILFLSFYIKFFNVLPFFWQRLIFTIYWLGFLCFLFLLAYYDFRTQYVSLKILIAGYIFWLIFFGLKSYFRLNFLDFNFLETLDSIFNLNFSLKILFNLAFSLIFLIVAFYGGLGYGDVPTIFLIGLFLKPSELVFSIFLAGIFGTIISLPFLIFKKYTLKTRLPFLPFLFLGVWVTILFGNEISKILFNF